MVGINDLAAGTDRADVLSSYAALLQTLDHAGAKPIIQSTLTCRIHQRCPLSDLLWLNQELEVLAAQHGYGFLDLQPAFASENGALRDDFTTDGIHLNTAGYAQWIDILEQDLSQRLAL